MDLNLSSEQKMLIETVRRFVENELYPLEEEVEKNGFLEPEKAKALFQKSQENGLYAMNIPEQFGGGGLSAVDTMLVEEEFGRSKDILIRRAFGNVYEMLLVCNEEQQKRWLLPCVQGERTCSIATTEPNAGSDAASIKTRAVKDGDGWRLNGMKHFVSDGAYSDFFLVSAVTDPEKGPKGISVFIVDKAMKGVTMGKDQPMMGLRGTTHLEMYLDDVRLEPINLLGELGGGFKIMLETLGRVRLAQVGARAVGKSVRLMQTMRQYAIDRKQFGQSIGNFQMIQTMIADSAIEINAARWMLLDAANDIDHGLDPREKISMVKIYAAEVLGRVADRAVQVFGGMGFCTESLVEHLYRDARIYRIFDGTSEIHRIQVAKGVLKHGDRLYALNA